MIREWRPGWKHIRDLKSAGSKKIFREQVSSIAQRSQLESALDYVREGDTLVVTKLDRPARATLHLWEIVQRLDAKGVALRILNLGGETVDTRAATGRLILNVLATFAQFEREWCLNGSGKGLPG
jgi:DNA invertase Pin-like site-specific DNA recombinase